MTRLVKPRKKTTLKKDGPKKGRHEQSLYLNLVEKGNDGIIIIQDGLLKFANRKIEKITGYSRKEALGKPFINFVSPEYRKVVLDRYKKRLKGERVSSKYEIEIQSKKGRKVPVEVNASLITHQNKAADMAIIRDITERKKSEVLVADEKRKMEMIYKTTKEGITLYDKDCRVIYINPSLIKLFGFKKNILGQKRSYIASHRDKYYKHKIERSDDVRETEKTCLAGKSVSNIFIKIYSKPTRYIEADYVPIKGKDGKVLGIVGSFRDVTLQKTQSEKIKKNLTEVEKQKNRLEAVFENVEEGVFVVDNKSRLIQANDACEIMSGFVEKEMIGRSYFEVFGCHDRHDHYYPEFDPTSKVLATKESIPYDEHLHKNAHGEERWVGVSYTPILDEKGDIEQVVGVIRDITKIKELEKAKSEFVSVASHELRTPLTVINGYLSLLLGGDLGNLNENNSREAYLAALNKVFGETKRLTKLVEELLNVTRIEEGRLKLTLRKIAIVDVVEEVVSEFKTLTQRRGIYLELEHNIENGRRIYVIGDKYKLKEILVNLIDNAVKFTDPGGKVTIKCQTKGTMVNIQVIDTGSGIAPSMLPFVFEKFQQVRSPYLKENKGTGLGLFIVKSLVEMHKGKVSVQSKPGTGSKFAFNLPIIADR